MGARANAWKPAYRPEIDGLRAIAVVAVVLYHARLLPGRGDPFAGGYLGVDIFFVISGYLIARLILSERLATGSFSFAGFYERRARRILPVLLLVILASLPVAWLLLVPSALTEFARSIVSSLLFYSNVFFQREARVYGAESALLKPLLHSWSLSIEEQFYIVFPALLVLSLRVLGTGSRYLIALLLLLSLGCAQYLAWHDPEFNFFFSPSRFWELLAGVLVAGFEAGRGEMPARPARRLLALLGAAMIAAALAGFRAGTPHPSLFTALPVLGTALVIAFASPREAVGRVLAFAPLRGIGLISYSLYLWHYPVMGFARVQFGEPATGLKLALIALIFLLSILSYVAVERPFRDRKRMPRRAFLAVILPAYGGLLLAAWLTVTQQGFPARFSYTGAFAHFNLDNRALLRKRQDMIDARNRVQPQFGDVPNKVLIVGNSHGKDMFNALSQNRDAFTGFDFMYSNAPQVSALAEGDVPEKVAHPRERFYGSPEYAAATTILVSTRYQHRADLSAARDGAQPTDIDVLPALIARARRDGKKVVVMSNTAEFRKIEKDWVTDYIYHKYSGTPGSRDPASLAAYKAEADRLMFTLLSPKIVALNARIREIAERGGATFVDKVPFVCNAAAEECSAFTDDGYKTMADYGHWTMQGAAYFGKRLAADPQFRAALAK